MKKRLILNLLGVLALACAPARAQVFIKPSGARAIPVRVQNLRADVEIVGAFAITDWVMEIQMEGVGFGDGRGGVCDFIVARPPDAKVTAFAVNQWRGNLSGRVVERGLVAPRVAFRAAPNDPLARSGLNANNSFRATIYPVSTWNSVTVRGTWVQVLPSNARRSTFRLPLLSLRGATTRLGVLNAKIRVRETSGIKISNSFGLPGRGQNGVRTFSLGQKNYRVTRDPVFNILAPSAPSQTALLFSPREGKTGGTFALATVAGSALTAPKLAGDNLESQVASPRATKAGQVVLLSGQYRGDAKDLRLRLESEIADLRFAAVENRVASALWATQGIDALGANPANRARVIALSKTHLVASRYTSWLAVGDEDLKIYARALVSSQLDPLVREYWLRVGDGNAKGARTLQLRRAIAQISRANGLNERDELFTRLGSAINYAAYDGGWHYGSAPRTRKEKRFARLNVEMTRFAKSLGIKEEADRDPVYRVYSGKRSELYDLRTKIIAELRKPHPNYEQLQALQLRFARLYGSSDFDPRLDFWRAEVRARELEIQTQNAEKAGDSARLAQLQTERNRNSGNAYFTNNIGDPPIYVSAPKDARRVVAIMPGGEVKVLDFNTSKSRWEGNYDVPATMREGTYRIQIVISLADGTRRSYAMGFCVDTTAPTGRGAVVMAPRSAGDAPMMRLEIEHGGDVARASALLPWGQKVALLPSTVRANHFFALVAVPEKFAGQTVRVNYVLVDRAHNLTSIEAESRSESEAR